MTITSMHNRIISNVGRSILMPMGLIQKGRSRLWIDDQRWYAIVVEFQPSNGSKGTYLNVGLSWLWYPQSHWSFDVGHRENGFVEFASNEQFIGAVKVMARRAATRVTDIRSQYASIVLAHGHATKAYGDELGGGGWPDLHLGILTILSGNKAFGETLLTSVAHQNADNDWQREMADFAVAALKHVKRDGSLARWIEIQLRVGRAKRGLPSIDGRCISDS